MIKQMWSQVGKRLGKNGNVPDQKIRFLRDIRLSVLHVIRGMLIV